ncbi:alanine--tRNA ligase [Candidatus Dependentiae bacterium]|nr:alanine--tRNA ligase [Candidatus Dependentiae bacterium]
MKTATQLRKEFIDFFKELDHHYIPSSSLLPIDDPTLLFTNAGMNQFKEIFLGYKKPEFSRVVNYQRCLRAGGKHNDLDEVGHDTYHHTLFEMLGNWSFGDYYKKETIVWAWKLITEVWKIPKSRLYATVYTTDDEAFEIWEKFTDVGSDRIFRFGKKYNFWEMGETGPCGPASELHIDTTEDNTGSPDLINADTNDLIELWNLVFIQYNNKGNNNLEDLPNFHVDTGMGLERLSAIMNGYRSNYQTDLFQGIIKDVAGTLGIGYGDSPVTDASLNVIADHLRALVFSIADGVLPSNEGRGYVLRRILRRGVRHVKKLNFNEPFIYKFVPTIVKLMGQAYPEINEKRDFIIHTIYSEEENFLKTLDNGLRILEEKLSKLKSDNKNLLSGEDVFYLYDTFGFPADLTGIICEEKGFKVDIEKFKTTMKKRQSETRSKRAKASSGIIEQLKGLSPTEFLGYDKLIADGKVLLILDESGNPIKKITSAKKGWLITDKTSFYGEKGGQVGDIGSILRPDFTFEVSAVKNYNDIIVHFGKVKAGELNVGDQVKLAVNKEYRNGIIRNHTATHLLHSGLRKILGGHVKQSGSLVESEKLRFDFNHFEGLSIEQLEEVEKFVQNEILKDKIVETKVLSFDEAKAAGALALFTEKYSSEVRTIRIGDASFELCGGTHCSRTGEIGLFKIINEFSISAGVRRIEAITGIAALVDYQDLFKSRKILDEILKSSGRNPVEEVMKLQMEIKELNEKLKKFQNKKSSSLADEISDQIEKVNAIPILIKELDLKKKELGQVMDNLKAKIKNGIIILYTGKPKPFFTVGISGDLINSFSAAELLNIIIKPMNGRGGGRKDFAQGGAQDFSKLTIGLNDLRTFIKKIKR